MPIGTVKWFDNRKGWGFVVQPDGSDLFVHYTSIVGDGFRRLDDGAKVEYELEDGPKGPQAGNVRLLDDGGAEGGAPAADAAESAPAEASGEADSAPSGDSDADSGDGNGAEAESEEEPAANG